MIVGNFSDITAVSHIHPRLTAAIDWIKDCYLQLPLGKATLEEGVIWANVENPIMKAASEQILEVHRRFIDIHVPVDRTEQIGYLPTCMLRDCTVPYDEARDIAFYSCPPLCHITLQPGDFAVMFPHDAHAPLIGAQAGVPFRKICVKIAVW